MVDNTTVDQQLHKKIFFVLLAFMLVVMLFQSRNYGMNWDEYWFRDYGEKVFNFYSSFGQDQSFINQQRSTTYEIVPYYGGMSEFFGALLSKIFSSRDPYDNRHLVTAVFGFIAIVFCGLTAQVLSGWRSAILASSFLFVTPVFFANSMHNSKDVPFAAGYIVAIYFMMALIKEWPKFDIKNAIGLAIGMSMAIGVRVGGVLLIGYLGLFFIAKNLYFFKEGQYKSKEELLTQIKKGILPLTLIVIAGYIGSLLFWPYALLNPISVPMKALKIFSEINFFDSNGLFEGRWVHRWEIPWYYIPKWIFITTPLFISLTPLVLVVLLLAKRGKLDKNQVLYQAMLLFTSVFPVAYIIFKQSNIFDGWRHTYFVYPPIVVVCAMLWNELFSFSKKQVSLILGIWLLIFTLEPFFFMIRNHPNEQFYFSPIIGGISGAFKKYEIDYYGTSLRGAIEWLAKTKEVIESKNKLRVNSLYGEPNSAKHYIDKYPQLVFVGHQEPSDYSLVLPSIAKHNNELLLNWPPPNTIHQIKADGVPLIAIVKNDSALPSQAKEDLIAKLKSDSKDLNFFLDLSLQFFLAKDYLNAIVAAEKAIALDKNSAVAYNNICSSLNNLFLFADGAEAGKKAMEIAPDFQLAKNNYNYSLSRKDEQIDPNVKTQNYLNLSFAFYNIGNQEKTIEFAEKVLTVDPNNVVAYNNLCVAYIQLKQLDKAINAAEKALKISPDFQLAKNNLAWAKSEKEKP
ncbi:MAG: tetratricopeptide repeat protein [Acidobacteria bacterium]|nr:tetratricopeptide repeat protein [Acidobacteriota bacterium]